MATYKYGGQALIEGVLMRGRNALAIALRHPDGSIVWATERLDMGLRARRAMKLPLLRGLVVLYDTLVTGTRWLVRSATLQALAIEAGDGEKPGTGSAAAGAGTGPAATILGGAFRTIALVFGGPALCAAAGEGTGDAPDEPAAAPKRAARKTAATASEAATSAAAPAAPAAPANTTPYSDPDATSAPATAAPAEQGIGKGYQVAVGGMLLLSLVLGIAFFFLLPLFLAQATVGRVNQGFGLQITEGIIRIAIFVGYLLLVGRAGDVRRTFQYHGAEHMSIHTLEGGDPLTVEAARKYPTAHPRCGTEFLVVVVIVSILAFALVGSQPPLILLASRVLLVPVIAAISYELLQLGARHRSRRVVRWLSAPGIWVQAITTKQPTDAMIEVAIVSLEQAMEADGAEVPPGSTVFARRPLDMSATNSAGVGS
jgi:uncharacterized protein YqhQ